MSDTVFSGVEKLTKLLNGELKLLEKMKELTDEQARQIEADEFDGLGELLNERQALIEKINGLHQESNPLMQSYVSSSDYGAVLQIDNLRNKIKQTLLECKELNEKNVGALADKTKDHTEKIDQQSTKIKGIGGYAQAVTSTSERFDKKT